MVFEQNVQGAPNFGMGGFVPQGTGMQFNGYSQAPTAQMNVLTNEEISQLMKKENSFSLALSETDKLRAACNHRRPDGLNDALYDDEDGAVRCSICGYKFRPIDANVNATSKETITAACSEITDILQTIKMIWIDIDNTVAREYFQLIPLIDKIPELFEIAAKNFAKHGNINPWVNNNRNMGTLQVFNMLSGIINGQTPYQAQPQQQMAYGAPMGQPMPQMAPQMGAPVYPTNGFGYMGTAPMGYQPQTGGFQTQYGAPVVDAVAQQPQAAPQPAQAEPTPAPANTDPNAAGFKA